MSARLVLDEFDLNLSAFSPSLLVVIVIIIACKGRPRAFCSSRVNPIAGKVVTRRWVVETSRGISDVGHYGWGSSEAVEVCRCLPKEEKCQ